MSRDFSSLNARFAFAALEDLGTCAKGEAGARLVAGAKIALAHGNGGTLSSQSTALLGSARTL